MREEGKKREKGRTRKEEKKRCWMECWGGRESHTDAYGRQIQKEIKDQQTGKVEKVLQRKIETGKTIVTERKEG